jgi:uncharacterized protein
MTQRIAIIGSGLSGLALAYDLKGGDCVVDMYESAPLAGGNAFTSHVAFDSMQRFADLGVNDFNLNTYTNIVRMLNQLKIPYLDLEDSASFFTDDGAITYTLDGHYGTPMPQKVKDGFAFFQQQAPKDYLDPAFANYSIAQYLATPQYAQYMPDLALQCIYPRVNAMYFCADAGAPGMPFVAIMHYYVLQEGMGTTLGPERKYWVGGTMATWIPRLGAVCGARMFYTNASVSISGGKGNWRVANGQAVQVYDTIAITCHASDALPLFTSGLPAPAGNLLSQFTYTQSPAFAHVWPGVLPANRNAWRTYNVRIPQPGESPSPYRMTYVENRHQYDAANPDLNYYGGAEYFTSLNPVTPIPKDLILTDSVTGQPCQTVFRHNVVDLTAMFQQTQLPQIQGVNGIYYAGGWTNGAGLHEECWIQAQKTAQLILGQEVEHDHVYDASRGHGLCAPRHMRKALGIE